MTRQISQHLFFIRLVSSNQAHGLIRKKRH